MEEMRQRIADTVAKSNEQNKRINELLGEIADSVKPTVSFERFTDRARKALQLANQEALRHENEWLGTEHLLVGILREGGGVAVNVLRNLDINPTEVLLAAEKAVVRGVASVPMGRLPRTPRCDRVLLRAVIASSEMGHNYVGTEHLLLGLIATSGGPGHEVLNSFSLTFDKVRGAIAEILGGSEHWLVTFGHKNPELDGTLKPLVTAFLAFEQCIGTDDPEEDEDTPIIVEG